MQHGLPPGRIAVPRRNPSARCALPRLHAETQTRRSRPARVPSADGPATPLIAQDKSHCVRSRAPAAIASTTARRPRLHDESIRGPRQGIGSSPRCCKSPTRIRTSRNCPADRCSTCQPAAGAGFGHRHAQALRRLRSASMFAASSNEASSMPQSYLPCKLNGSHRWVFARKTTKTQKIRCRPRCTQEGRPEGAEF